MEDPTLRCSSVSPKTKYMHNVLQCFKVDLMDVVP